MGFQGFLPSSCDSSTDFLLIGYGYKALHIWMGAFVELPQTLVGLTHELAQLLGTFPARSGGQFLANLPEFGHATGFCEAKIKSLTCKLIYRLINIFSANLN